jgi:hypothetical protein
MLKRMTAAAEQPLDFNTAIAEIYKLLNVIDAAKVDPKTDDEKRALREVLEITAKVLAPMAPFLGEEYPRDARRPGQRLQIALAGVRRRSREGGHHRGPGPGQRQAPRQVHRGRGLDPGSAEGNGARAAGARGADTEEGDRRPRQARERRSV